jgi:hypothetical protein
LALLAVPIISMETGRSLGVVELLNKRRTTVFNTEAELELSLVSKMIATIVEKV